VEDGRSAHADVQQRLVGEVEQLLVELRISRVPTVRPASHLVRDLGLDSLAIVEFRDRLEAAFGVSLADGLLSSAATVEDWVGAVLAAGGARVGEAAARPTPRPEAAPAAGMPAAAAPDGAETLLDTVAWHLDHEPDRVALRLLGEGPDGGVETLTYAELAEEADRFARGLAGLAEPGEQVAIMLPTCREYFVAFLGTVMASAVPVPIYPPARAADVGEHVPRQARILTNAHAVVLVSFPEARIVARMLSPRVPSLRAVVTVEEVATRAPQGGREGRAWAANADDTVLVQYTSGSTGDPKGVVLTHRQLLANIRAMGAAAEVRPSDVFVSWLPLYHDMGLIGAWLAGFGLGFTSVVMSPLVFLSRPARWLRAMSEFGGTLSAAPNFAYQLCVDRITDGELEGVDLSGWRVAFNGAETVSPETIDRFCRRFGPFGFRREAMAPAYGLAEAGLGIAFPPVGRGPVVDVIEREPFARSGRAVPAAADAPTAMRVVGSGMPIGGYEVRIVGGGGTELGARREGSVEFRGPSATSGYLNNEVATGELVDGSWLRTGDLGYTADGELFLTGREKDVVIRAGRNLHPAELERAVGELDGVVTGGVAVFASADPVLRTERLVVVAESDLVDEARRRALNAAIVSMTVDLLGTPPDDVVLVRRGAVLRTANRKLRRDAMRQRYERGRLDVAPRRAAVQLAGLACAAAWAGARRRVRAGADLGYAAYVWTTVGLVCCPLFVAVALRRTVAARWALTCRAIERIRRLVGFGLTVEGDPAALPRPCVVVANHASFIDGALLIRVLNSPAIFMVGSEFAGQPVVGSFLRRIGCVFVHRGSAEHSVAEVAGLAAELERGARMVAFPEGGLSRAPALRPFHLGAFAVATAAGCPVVPIAIRGTRDIVRPGSRRPRRGDIRVVIGEAIQAEGGDLAARLALRDEARRRLTVLLGPRPADAGSSGG